MTPFLLNALFVCLIKLPVECSIEYSVAKESLLSILNSCLSFIDVAILLFLGLSCAVYCRGGQHWLKGLEPNKLINQRASKYDWILLHIDIKSMQFQALFHETGDYSDSWPSGIFSLMHSARVTIGGSWSPLQRIFSPDCSVRVESKLWEESWLFQLLSMSEWWRQLCSWETSQRHLLSS